MGERVEMPRYIKISIDVALRICKGKLLVGDKLRGRSILASEYNVSPETIRKAMKLLEDKGVVNVNKGSGIIIRSREKAFEFTESFKDKETLKSIRCNIRSLLEERRMLDRKIEENYNKAMDHLYRFKDSQLIEHIEIKINEKCKHIGKSIGQTKFWHNTGATILGIRRGDNIYISPGPYWEFESGDVLLIVGDEGVLKRTEQYLYEG